jgi:hypothetical protein
MGQEQRIKTFWEKVEKTDGCQKRAREARQLARLL